mgnify:CR=1 FL=1
MITKKQYEEAIKDCDIIIKSDAKNLYAYHNKVMALRMLEDYENALKSCDKIISYMGNIDNYGLVNTMIYKISLYIKYHNQLIYNTVYNQ